ncbi:MAG TPA: hypothetical protein PKB15_05655 [Acidimicrobiia bacterium]|nr:hypothetical protein [Acidimicrobiia bacterium]
MTTNNALTISSVALNVHPLAQSAANRPSDSDWFAALRDNNRDPELTELFEVLNPKQSGKRNRDRIHDLQNDPDVRSDVLPDEILLASTNDPSRLLHLTRYVPGRSLERTFAPAQTLS